MIQTSKVLPGLPERISHVIRRHAVERTDHPTLTHGETTWSHGALWTIVTDLAGRLVEYGIRLGKRRLITSANTLSLAALACAAGERCSSPS